VNRHRSARALLAWAVELLGHAGVSSAPLDADLMLEHATSMPRLRRMAMGDDLVGEPAALAFETFVRRRSRREPLQHVLGSAGFLDMDLQVDARVLVPRPETEQLVLMASACVMAKAPARILDLGTGSGCIALALAGRHPVAEVVGVDVSSSALEVARENARRLGMEDRVRWVEGDAFRDGAWSSEGLMGLGSFDLVVSNPPYIPTAEIPGLEPEVRDHDPRLALDGGADGLGPYRALAANGWMGLGPGGALALEFGDGQGPALMRLFARDEWRDARLGKDLSGRDRVLIVRGSRR
jgi:release factor glutamine methyltransferase